MQLRDMIKHGVVGLQPSDGIIDTDTYPWVVTGATAIVNGIDIDITMASQRPSITSLQLLDADTDYLIVFDVSANTFTNRVRPASAASDCWAELGDVIPLGASGELRSVRKTKAGGYVKTAFIGVGSGTGQIICKLRLFLASDFNDPLNDPLPPYES